MWLLKKGSKGFYLCFFFLLVLAVGSSLIAHADSGTATTTLRGGSLTEANATNLVKLKLSQSNKQSGLASYTLPIAVDDARGTGNGWKLTITSTTFQLNEKYIKKHYLPTNASRIMSVSVTCSRHSTCKKPVNSIAYPIVIPAGVPAPSPVKFFNAAAKSGLGTFALSMIVSVAIPANTETGVYTTTITLSLANGP